MSNPEPFPSRAVVEGFGTLTGKGKLSVKQGDKTVGSTTLTLRVRDGAGRSARRTGRPVPVIRL